MTIPDPNSNALAPLLELLLDGSLSSDQWTQLREILATNPAAAEQYIDFVTLHALLESELEWHGALQVPELFAEASGHDEFAPAGRDAETSPALSVKESDNAEDAGLARPTPPAWEESRKIAGKSRRRFWYGFAATILIGLSALTMMLTRSSTKAPATLGATMSAEWEAPNASLATGAPLPDGLLELKAGVAEVKFGSGASMIVEGPARFRILDANAASLALGKLTATVPPEAHGFSVQTSVSRIVDLGTEFGVEMREDHSMRADVFRGRVEMHAIAGSPDAAPTMLTANHAVEISTGGLATVPATPHPERFIRALSNHLSHPASDSPNYERWLAFSQELRRDPTLVLYYTLEDEQPTAALAVLPNRAVDTAGQYDISLAGPNAPTLQPGRWPDHGLAMDFVATKKQRLLLENYPPVRDGQMTVLAWVYARSRPTYANIVNNWNWSGSERAQFHVGLWDRDGDVSMKVAQLHGPDLFAREAKPFPTQRWCQLALVVDNTMLRLYRDGNEIAATPAPGFLPAPPSRALAIGFKPGRNGRDPDSTPDFGFWDGRIDELAIFHRALSPEEIRTSYEAGAVVH